MASNVSVGIGVDTGDLQAKIALAQSAFKDFSAQVRDLANQARAAGDETRASLTTELETMAQKAAQAKAEIASLRTQLGGTAGETRGLFGGLTESIEGIRGSIASITTGLAGALGLREIAGFVVDIINLGDSMERASEKTGLTVQQLSGLKLAADKNETSFEQLQSMLLRFNNNVHEAETGSGRAAAAFLAMGFNTAFLKQHGDDTAFMLQAVAQRLSEWEDKGNKASLVAATFGLRMQEANPILKELAEGGFTALIAKAKELGAEFDPNFTKAAKDAHDRMVEVSAALLGLKIAIANSGLIQNVIDLATALKLLLEGKPDGLEARLAAANKELRLMEEHLAQVEAGGGTPGDRLFPETAKETLKTRIAEVKAQIDALNTALHGVSIPINEPPAPPPKPPGQAPAIGMSPEEIANLDKKIALEDQRNRDQMIAAETRDLEKAGDEQYRIAQATATRKTQLAKDAFQEGRITLDQETAALLGAENERYQAELSNLNSRLQLYAQDEAKYKEALQRKEQADVEHATRTQQIEHNAAMQVQRDWEQAFTSIVGPVNSALRGVLDGTETWKQAMLSVFESLAFKAIEYFEQIAIKWAAAQLAGRAGAAAAAFGQIQTDAAVAAAGAYAATVSIPYVGPELAPAAAAEAYAATIGWAAGIGGGLGTAALSSDQLVLAHAQEMILPPKLSRGLADAISAGSFSGGATGAAGSGGAGAPNITVNFSPNISAVDAASVQRLFLQNGGVLAQTISQQIRNANSNLTQHLPR
jgi:hypothetical protein